jgi:hypothetical protein
MLEYLFDVLVVFGGFLVANFCVFQVVATIRVGPVATKFIDDSLIKYDKKRVNRRDLYTIIINVIIILVVSTLVAVFLNNRLGGFAIGFIIGTFIVILKAKPTEQHIQEYLHSINYLIDQQSLREAMERDLYIQKQIDDLFNMGQR